MKKFSIRLLMLAALVSIACSAYSPKTTHRLAAPSAKTASAKVDQCFFWFMVPGDFFDEYAGLSVEILWMESFAGGLVNTNPFGGIILEYGYSLPTYPHTMNPVVGLYLHL
jgi:hypothetical protein